MKNYSYILFHAPLNPQLSSSLWKFFFLFLYPYGIFMKSFNHIYIFKDNTLFFIYLSTNIKINYPQHLNK